MALPCGLASDELVYLELNSMISELLVRNSDNSWCCASCPYSSLRKSHVQGLIGHVAWQKWVGGGGNNFARNSGVFFAFWTSVLRIRDSLVRIQIRGLFFLKLHLHHLKKIKSHKEVKKLYIGMDFFLTIFAWIEGSRSVPRTNGSGSRRPKNLRIRIQEAQKHANPDPQHCLTFYILEF